MDKEKNKGTELIKLALNQHRWINTPASYTTIGSQLQSLQQDVMLMVSGKLQDYMKKYFEEEHHKDRKNSYCGSHVSPLISEQALREMPPIRINLSDLGVSDTNYAYVEKMLKAIQELWIRVPVFDTNSGLKNGELRVPVFKKIFIPSKDTNAEGEEYRYRRAAGGEHLQRGRRRCPYIEVAINSEAAAYAFDMSAGYINHLERIALWCSSCYTSRLYLLLMKYVGMGNMCPVIDYFELKDFLGMIDRDEESGEVTGEKYRGFFSRFSKSVLNVAKRDMERLSIDNKIEIVLDETRAENGYEAIYRGERKRGNPDAIRFYIKRNALGIARDIRVHRARGEMKLVAALLEMYPSLDKGGLLEIFSEVSDEMWKNFCKYAYKELPTVVERPHRWNGSAEGFVMYLLKQRAGMVNEEKSSGRKVRDDLFGDVADDVRPDGATESTRVEGEYAEEWSRVMSDYDGALKPLLERAVHKGSDRGFIWIEFPDRESLEAYEEAERNPALAKDVKRLRKIIASVMPIGMPSVIVRGVRK